MQPFAAIPATPGDRLSRSPEGR